MAKILIDTKGWKWYIKDELIGKYFLHRKDDKVYRIDGFNDYYYKCTDEDGKQNNYLLMQDFIGEVLNVEY